MTAVPSSSDRRPLLVRALAAVLSAAVAWTPWAVTWADQISNAAAAGQAAGATARGALALPSQSGNAIVMPGGTGGNLSFTTLFPGSAGGDPATFSGLYGNDIGVKLQGQAAQANLPGENAPQGAAYRTLRSAVDRSRPDMRNDPLWAQTDAVLDNFQDIADTFADCQTVTTFNDTTRQTHVPDYRTCDRLTDIANTTCTAVRTFVGSTFHHAWTINHPFGGNSHFDVTFNLRTGTGSTPQWIWDHATQQPVRLPDYQFDIGRSLGDDYCHQANATVEITNLRRTLRCHENGIWSLRTLPLPAEMMEFISIPSCQNGLVGIVRFYYNRTPMDERDPPDPEGEQCDGVSETPVVDIVGSAIPQDSWAWLGHGCPQVLDMAGNGFCTSAVACTDNPNSDCITDQGMTWCGASLSAPPISGQGVGRGCKRIEATIDCRGFNRGQMDCWTDTSGNLQCPFNEGNVNNDCAALEQDANCGYIRSNCVEGARDNRGVCFLHEETWDCGTLRSIPVLERLQSIDCAGPVRCMGTDCVNPGREQSADFAKAVAALEAAQMMVTDMQCGSGGHCVVFNGEGNECKRAVGGIVNCCKTPDGVSLGNYLTLIFSLAKLDSAILGMNKGGAIRGSWEALRQPVTSTWSAVKESFSSVANSLTGATAEAATDAAAQGVLAAAKQEVLSKTATWAAQTFGDAAVNVLFSTVEGGAAVTNGSVQGVLQLGGGQAWLGSLMAWAMWAYTIYTVAMILIKLIWTCEKKEFELGAKRELKSCHHVGGYCKSKLLSWCVEKRDTYCCFNTPLARILNEQIRPQLGRGWGSPKNPDCTGINVHDFSRVDWSQVNLDEWLSILFETGHFPTAATINLERLTGTGSVLSGGNRENSVERSIGRTTGLDAEQTRRDAEQELWSDALPNLP